ncbi:TDP-N-acetylfucosamine:lipid II N-acetylfucosaminyltransferase [Salimicrobium album]|uniref:4-alpha-L-fucosyltransferase glycosyl transferase group 56 n=1 Tax=Salimicrobium album TaxID=50717 RepID=A0A1H3EKD6_9BACI|nr:TDP-N-acetylfucosamine:lipid II N-acetylfucosaminyltransferase [Salimicrobium album]SDX79067.1 4-alpha-L-fucosyltransferase glycosyl transferase group 56 [Salimicrobium album]
MKILHIENTDKFVEPFNAFINNNFNKNDHEFALNISKDEDKFKLLMNNMTYIKGYKGLIKINNKMYLSKKIILHSLPKPKILLLLALQPWLLKKCYWVIWGSDLYNYRKPKKKIKDKILESVKKYIVKRFKGIVSLVPGDYELARRWYGVQGKYYHGIYVNPINIKFLNILKKDDSKRKDTINIQIGNSAAPTNNHIEVLEQLYKFKNQNIKIFAPLSYGNKSHASKVSEYGKTLFGDKFIPLTNFLSPPRYAEYLSNIDIGIFNNNRQQGIFNINSFLYLNKTVMLRTDTTMWDFYKQFKVQLHSINELNHTQEITSIVNKSTNNKNIKKLFDEEYIKFYWENIFDD